MIVVIRIIMVLLCSVLISAESIDSFRYRANYMIKQQWNHADIKAEVEFGRRLTAKLLAQYPLLDDNRVQRYVNLLGQGIVAMVGRADIHYYFSVIESDHINAYAAPGGYVMVTTGLLKHCQNEAQLVGVLAHEISHINRRYIVEKFNIRGDDGAMLDTVGIVIGGSTQTSRLALDGVVSQVMDMLLMDGLDQDEELMADQEAVQFMGALNYDWREYRDLVGQIEGDHHSESVSKTHPSSNDRQQMMQLSVINHQISGQYVKKDRFKEYVPF